MNFCLIILAAGNSHRFKSNINKPYQKLAGKSLIEISIDKARQFKQIKKIIVVFNKKDTKKVKSLKLDNVKLIVGGKNRQMSTFKALNYLKAKNLYFENYYFTGEYSGINNTLVEILFGAGVVGLFIFLGFIYFHLRKYPILILTFIIMSFNGSHLNNSFFWIFLTFISIYNYIKPLKQKYVD